jgi:F-type H+-transporting ATPase subunit gamma
MATLKEIRRRITSIKSTQQITKAMKMVAAAKLRRAQQRILAARPYARKIDELIHNLISTVENFDDPLIQERAIEKVTLVVVTSDRGLCGSFNGNIIKKTLMEVDSLKGVEVEIVPVGRKAYDFFRKRKFNLGREYINFFNDLRFDHAKEITNYLKQEFIEGKTDQIKLVYNEFKSAIQQNLIIEDLIPIQVNPKSDEKDDRETSTPTQHLKPDFIYEPSQNEILLQLLPKHLNIQMWRVLLESSAAEQGARMAAMENATENANELIYDLTLQYNKARQASITKELIEIVSGAEALRGV